VGVAPGYLLRPLRGRKHQQWLGSLDKKFKLNGLNPSATGYPSKRLGITGDFSANFANRADTFGTDTSNSKVSLYNFMAGPQ
jgi:hypothetical protein